MASVACIVLAAGRSTRFGADKMLQILPSGVSVLETTVNQYLKVFEQLTLVVRSTAVVSLSGLSSDPRLKLAEIDDSTQGLSHSLKEGLIANQICDGWLIALGDMPYVQSNTISELRDNLTADNIVVPMLQGRQGNPVGFGIHFKQRLMALSGDIGAKSIIQQHASRLVSIETKDRGVVQDIDHPSDIL